MREHSDDLVIEILEGVPPTVVLSGQADFYTRDRIAEAFNKLFDIGSMVVKVDLTDLKHLDSSAFAALIKSAIRAKEAGGLIELVGVSDRVSRMLTLCGAAVFFKADIPGAQSAPEEVAPEDDLWQVSNFHIHASPDAIALARERLMLPIRNLPFSNREVCDILVAVSEAITNAIKHGCDCDSGKIVTIRCVADARHLVVEISDPGAGFDLIQVDSTDDDFASDRGIGIQLMRKCMDEVVFSFGSLTTVRLVKIIRNSASI